MYSNQKCLFHKFIYKENQLVGEMKCAKFVLVQKDFNHRFKVVAHKRPIS